eukprot:COSAG05_NODE_142_length_16591_cov_6.726837_5_plen_68_part_00
MPIVVLGGMVATGPNLVGRHTKLCSKDLQKRFWIDQHDGRFWDNTRKSRLLGNISVLVAMTATGTAL